MENTPKLIDLPLFVDKRGKLGVIEGADLPFEIRRMYYLFDVPMGATRGEHGHKTLRQFILCMNGRCEVRLSDGRTHFEFVLDDPAQALYVPSGIWRRLVFREPATVCCVLASQPYDRDDYLMSFDDFLAWKQAQEN